MNVESNSVSKLFLTVPKQLVPAAVVLGVSTAADIAHTVLPPVVEAVAGQLGSYVGSSASFVTRGITWIPAVASRGVLTFVYGYAAKAIGGAVIFRLSSAGEFMKTKVYSEAFQTTKEALKDRILKLKGCRNVLLGTAIAYQALAALGITAEGLMPLFIPAAPQTLATWAFVFGSGCGLAAAWMGSIARTPRVIPKNENDISATFNNVVKCALVNGSITQSQINERTFVEESKTAEERTLERLETEKQRAVERAEELKAAKKASKDEFLRLTGEVTVLTPKVAGNAALQPKLTRAQEKLDLVTADRGQIKHDLDTVLEQLGELETQIQTTEPLAAQAILRKQKQHKKTVANTCNRISRLAAMYLLETGTASDFSKRTLLKVSAGTRKAKTKDAAWVVEQAEFAYQDLEKASAWLKKASTKQKYKLERELLKLDLDNLPAPSENEKDEASVLRWLGHASSAMAGSKFVTGQISAALVGQYKAPQRPKTNQRFWNTLQA